MSNHKIVSEKSFEEIRKENEEQRKMLLEFNKGLQGDKSNRHRSSLVEEMNLNVSNKNMYLGKGFVW